MIDALRWLGVPPTEPLVAANDEKSEKKAKAPAPPPTIEEPEDASEPQPVVEAEDEAPRYEVPDFAGMSMGEALQAAQARGAAARGRGQRSGHGAVARAGRRSGAAPSARCRLHRRDKGLNVYAMTRLVRGVAGLHAAGRLHGMGGVRLGELLQGVEIAGVDGGGPDPEGAMSTSRSPRCATTRARSRAGDLFVATRGQTVDGHDFLGAAAERGAVAVVVEDGAAQGFPGVRVRVPATRALGADRGQSLGRPADALTLIGVTGTNGKTTTTFSSRRWCAPRAASRRDRHGDLSLRRRRARAAPFTTPTPLVLHATLAEMRAAGVTDVVMEASSHALELGRLDGVRFRVGAFTNLTQDHLDFHGTMEAYATPRRCCFASTSPTTAPAVINVDDEWGGSCCRRCAGARWR